VAEVPQSGKVYAIDFSPDGQRLLTASDRSLWIWDALPGAVRVPTLTHSNWVGFADFSTDGSLLVTAESVDLATPQHSNYDVVKTDPSCAAWIWNVHTGKRVAGPLWHEGGITSAHFSPNGTRVVTGSRDQTARVWDAATGQPLTGPLEHPQIVRFARFTPNGQRLITAGWLDRAWLWEASTGKMLLEFHDSGPGESSNISMPVRSEDISPDGRWLVTCSRDGGRVWDIPNGKFFQGPLAPGENIRAARFSPDGTRVITASFDHQACVWDVESGELITGPLRHNWIVLYAAFSADGRKVVTCSHDGTAKIWDAWSGEPLTKPLRHQGEVVYAEFSPDSRRLVTVSWWDKAALLWDAETGLPLSQPLRHDDWVTHATFSPDGRWIVTTGNDRKARLWEVPLALSPIPDWLPDLAEAIVGKRLNAQGSPEAVTTEELMAHKMRLRASKETDDYTRWGGWFFAARTERTVSAFSKVTTSDHTTRLTEENTLTSLTEALSLAPTNGLALARLARHVITDSTREKSCVLAEADFYSLRAFSLMPHDVEVQQIRTEVRKLVEGSQTVGKR
jgi:WD40 repeat protein